MISIKYGCLKCVYYYIISPKLGNGAIYCSNLKKSTKIFVDWNGPIKYQLITKTVVGLLQIFLNN